MLRNSNLIPLSHDHQRALALCVLTERSLRNDAGESNVAHCASQVIAQFDAEILTHFQSEEEILFPVLRDFPALAEVVAELLDEHGRMQGMIAALRKAPTQAAVENLCLLLTGHIRKEERVLFQQAQELLSPEQLDALGKQLASHPTSRACNL